MPIRLGRFKAIRGWSANNLIDYGWFACTRNPNYLGEFLVYYSFACLSGHELPKKILAAIVVFVLVTRNVEEGEIVGEKEWCTRVLSEFVDVYS